MNKSLQKSFFWRFEYGTCDEPRRHHHHRHHRNFVSARVPETIKYIYIIRRAQQWRYHNLLIHFDGFVVYSCVCVFCSFSTFLRCINWASVILPTMMMTQRCTSTSLECLSWVFFFSFFLGSVACYFGKIARLFPVLCFFFFCHFMQFFVRLQCYSFGRELNTAANMKTMTKKQFSIACFYCIRFLCCRRRRWRRRRRERHQWSLARSKYEKESVHAHQRYVIDNSACSPSSSFSASIRMAVVMVVVVQSEMWNLCGIDLVYWRHMCKRVSCVVVVVFFGLSFKKQFLSFRKRLYKAFFIRTFVVVVVVSFSLSHLIRIKREAYQRSAPTAWTTYKTKAYEGIEFWRV